jgi:N-acetylmuramoyl-L-alanine amidase
VKRVFVFFGIVLLLGLTSFNQPAQKEFKITKVVLDAGHGGKDPGCIGSKTKEKDITLSIVLKLGKLIETNFPDVKVIYTRNTDVFVELYNRAQIANQNKADLFISIHCNANPSKTPFGVETYVMGLHKSQANLDVAKKENSTILLEDDYSNKYDGFDPNSSEANIIFSLYQNAFLDQSLNLASKVQKQTKSKLGLFDRGVKQAGFLVLYKTTMPGILIESGFLSNAKDEEFLSTAKGQEYMASAIYSAFKGYKEELEGNTAQQSTNSDIIDSTYYKKITVKPDSLQNITAKKEIFFKVQFAASPAKKSLTSPDFKSVQDVQEYFHNGMYKYVAGYCKTLSEANILLKKIQDAGFKDAFVVAFVNGERISAQEAVKLIKKN